MRRALHGISVAVAGARVNRSILFARWGWAAAIAAVLAIAFSGQVWLDYAYARVPVSYPIALALSASDWFAWALLAPFVIALGDRERFARGRAVRAIGVHAAGCLLFSAAAVGIQQIVNTSIIGVARQPASFLKAYVTLGTYWAILAAGALVRMTRERRERDRRAEQLETALARAELDALKMRLHPHFLFNTLNGIAGLMREDVEAADLMLTRLGDLLRMTLDSAHIQEVPLKYELDVIERYLDIQQARFGERLRLEMAIDPETLALAVPSLSLQPLIENAILHGISRREGVSHIRVRSTVAGGALVVTVEDDGPGPPEVVEEGHGLETTRARLVRLYGDAASLSLHGRPEGGAVSRLSVPARLAPLAGPAA